MLILALFFYIGRKKPVSSNTENELDDRKLFIVSENLNDSQMRLVYLCITIILAMVLYPPWLVPTTLPVAEGSSINITIPIIEYDFIWHPPEVHHSGKLNLGGLTVQPFIGIDSYRLFFQIVFILAIAAVLVYVFKDKKVDRGGGGYLK